MTLAAADAFFKIFNMERINNMDWTPNAGDIVYIVDQYHNPYGRAKVVKVTEKLVIVNEEWLAGFSRRASRYSKECLGVSIFPTVDDGLRKRESILVDNVDAAKSKVAYTESLLAKLREEYKDALTVSPAASE